MDSLSFKYSFMAFSSALLNVLLNKHVSSIDCIEIPLSSNLYFTSFAELTSANIVLYSIPYFLYNSLNIFIATPFCSGKSF